MKVRNVCILCVAVIEILDTTWAALLPQGCGEFEIHWGVNTHLANR